MQNQQRESPSLFLKDSNWTQVECKCVAFDARWNDPQLFYQQIKGLYPVTSKDEPIRSIQELAYDQPNRRQHRFKSRETLVRALRPVQPLKSLPIKRLRILKLSWITGCFLALIYHSISLTFDYMMYESTTKVTFEMENRFVPPAISFCFVAVELRILGKFSPDSICRKNISVALNESQYEDCLLEMLYKRSVKQLFDHTLDLSYTVSAVIVSLDKSISYDLMDHETILKYVDEFYMDGTICLRFKNSQSPLFIRNDQVSRLSNSYMVYGEIEGNEKLYILDDDLPFIRFYIHPADTFPRGFELQPYVSISGSKSEVKLFNYRKFLGEYLPPPFSSNCVHHHKRQLESREHCFQGCIQSFIQRDYGMNKTAAQFTHIKAMVIDPKSPDMDFVPDLDRKNYSNIIRYNEICTPRCPLDCHTVSYAVDLISEAAATSANLSYKYRIENRNPTLHTKFVPVIPTAQYIIYLASAVGLWFGFDIFHGTNFIVSQSSQVFKRIQSDKSKI